MSLNTDTKSEYYSIPAPAGELGPSIPCILMAYYKSDMPTETEKKNIEKLWKSSYDQDLNSNASNEELAEKYGITLRAIKAMRDVMMFAKQSFHT